MIHALYKMKNNKYLNDCIAIVTKLSSEELPNEFTRPEIITFIKTSPDIYNKIITINDIRRMDDFFEDKIPLLRIGSECMFGMFGDKHCDCEAERITVLKMIGEQSGIYIHLPQEAQGQGLFYKAQELNIQVSGYLQNGSFVGQKSQAEAAKLLTGNEVIDTRGFGLIFSLLKEFGLDKYQYKLISKNPNKIKECKKSNIKLAGNVDVVSYMTNENIGEFLAKWLYKSHELTTDQCKQIIELLNSKEPIPMRAVSLLNEASFQLETDPQNIINRVNLSGDELEKFKYTLQNPENPTVINGAQSHLWSLLEKTPAYDEFQYELVLTDELDEYIIKNYLPEGQIKLWHEINNYFYLPLMSNKDRDLKIRITYDMREKFVSARLIHKVKLDTHRFRIRTINFSDPTMSDLLKVAVFSDYDQRIVESITNPYIYSDENLKIIIKRYSDNIRTLSLEGKEKYVLEWKQRAEDILDKRLKVVESDNRSFAPKIKNCNKFKLKDFMSLEFECARRYNNI